MTVCACQFLIKTVGIISHITRHISLFSFLAMGLRAINLLLPCNAPTLISDFFNDREEVQKTLLLMKFDYNCLARPAMNKTDAMKYLQRMCGRSMWLKRERNFVMRIIDFFLIWFVIRYRLSWKLK